MAGGRRFSGRREIERADSAASEFRRRRALHARRPSGGRLTRPQRMGCDQEVVDTSILESIWEIIVLAAQRFNQLLQLTPKGFASRLASRRDDHADF